MFEQVSRFFVVIRNAKKRTKAVTAQVARTV